MPLTQPKALYECICGDKHEAVARLANFPVLLCPHAPDNALYFWPNRPVLTTGKPKKEGKK